VIGGRSVSRVRPRHVLAGIALVCATALAILAGVELLHEGGATGRPTVLLGIADDREIVRVAPVSLRPLPGRGVRLTQPLGAWARSPDGRRLAAVSDRASELHLIEVDGMRTVVHVATGTRGSPIAVLWPRRDRVWIVVTALGTTTVVTVDVTAQRVLARRRLAGALVRVAASPDGAVLLLAPSSVIGPSRLATVDAAGAVAQIPIDGLSAGLMPTRVGPSVERVRTPALAVDPEGRRAYLVSSRPYVVEVDLRRHRASGHRLVPERSLLDRLRELLEPTAEAAVEVGPVRDAAWLGAGRIALSGYDGDALLRSDGGVEDDHRPAGLHVIDTRDWSIRTLDERASTFVAADGLLLTGGPDGLVAYDPEGDERFRLLDGRQVEIVASAGSLAYVRTPPEPALHVVDLEAERVIGTSEPGRVRLLADGITPAPAAGTGSAGAS
jgi:hypothetical protein